MIYLDNGATTFPKPAPVQQAVMQALNQCANPGRGGYGAAMEAMKTVYDTRNRAASVFDCEPEQVVFTSNCTHGLNIAIRSLVKSGDQVVISGFEHNAVTRPLRGLEARIRVAGQRLFDWEDTLEAFRRELDRGCDAVVLTHVSNVFGYVLPVEEIARMCRDRGVPFILDAAQSAGSIPVSLKNLGATYIAMPGHKGLLGPQGTGLLLCAGKPEPLLMGGTGSDSIRQQMPEDLPERLEAGTLNVPGIAGLGAGLAILEKRGIQNIGKREHYLGRRCAQGLRKLGMKVFAGPHQSGVVSFQPGCDCEEGAAILADRGIAVRAGLHCAPLAHESGGTLERGTIRVSFGYNSNMEEVGVLLRAASKLPALEN